jgi:hypothetical protein
MSLFSRIFGDKPKVYQQRKWTDEQLRAQGFHYYKPRKRISMARMLPASEAPKIIKTSWDTIIARAGYYIAYVAGDKVQKTLDDYDPRPIEPRIFMQTYRPWNEPNYKPTPAEAHLMKLGCKPYYKIAGVWAKRLKEETWVQSIESSKPSRAPAGAWLCVGTEGEPWTVTNEWFHERYILPDSGPHEKVGVR